MRDYVLSLSEKTLTITKAFEDAIAKGEGDAYKLYTQFLRDIPGLTVIRRTTQAPPSVFPGPPARSSTVISSRT